MDRSQPPSPAPEKRAFQFGEFRVDPVRRLLLRGGEPLPVTSKSFSLLLVLLERRGEVVEKEELIRRVWQGAFVTEANLTQNISSLRKVLGERAGDRRYIVTVPGRGYSFVAELDELPVEEPAASSSAAPDLEPVGLPPVSPPAPAPVPPPVDESIPQTGPVRAGDGWRIGLAALAVLGVLVASWFFVRSRPGQASAGRSGLPEMSTAARRPSIAVLGFKDLSAEGQADWLGPALAEMLTTELGAGGSVRVVSGENVARARNSLSLPYTDHLESESLGRLRNLLNADRVVIGSYLSLPAGGGRRIRLDLKVVDLASGERVVALTEVGTEAGLFDLVSRSGLRLRRALKLTEPSADQVRAVQAMLPSTPAATRLYVQGLARLRSADFPGARDLFIRAAAADPSSATIHVALSRAWLKLGYDTRAAAEARRALALATPLSREERLIIEARLHEANREWSKASEIYRSLWTFFPDDMEYGLLLASCLTYAGRNSEALEVIGVLRGQPPPAREDPRIDLAEAVAAMRLTDTATQKRAAEAALAKGRRSGERLVMAEALTQLGSGLLMEGKAKESLEPLRQARELNRQAGQPLGEATAVAYIGIARQRTGDLDGAEEAFLEALGMAQRLGSASNVAASYANLGKLYLDRGEPDRAFETLEKARLRYAETEEPLMELRVLYALGTVHVLRGELAAAEQRLQEAIARSRTVRSRMDEARALGDLARVLEARGQIDEARRHCETALPLLREPKVPAMLAAVLSTSGDIQVRLGDLAQAQQRYEEALAIRREAGDRIGAGQVLGRLARLALRQGALQRARQLSEEQLRIAAETGARALDAAAHRNLGDAALAAGDLARARISLGKGLATSVAVGDALQASAVRLDLARVHLAAGQPAEADSGARQVAAWASPRGAVTLETEALALTAEAMLLQGDLAGARAAAERARVQADRGEDRELRLLVAPVIARAEAAGGDTAGALRRLHRAIEEAGRLGFFTAGLESRLVLGEVEMGQGDPVQARARLEAVRRDAGTRGLRRLAAAAAGAAMSPPAISRRTL